MISAMRMILVALCILADLGGMAARATELKPETAAAFDRYVRAMEARMDEDTRLDHFLIVDRLPDARRAEVYEQLKNGQVYIEAMSAREGDRPIKAASSTGRCNTLLKFTGGSLKS
jgi:hypothetical protein